MKRVTERQLEVLATIAAVTRGKGYPPTVSELRSPLGLLSKYGVTDHLMRLARKGLIKRDETVARGIVITDLGRLGLRVAGYLPSEGGLLRAVGRKTLPTKEQEHMAKYTKASFIARHAEAHACAFEVTARKLRESPDMLFAAGVALAHSEKWRAAAKQEKKQREAP